MNRTDRVSASDMEALCEKYSVNRTATLSVGGGDNRFEFAVKRRLNAAEVSGIVETVCNGVVDAETGAYHPEFKDYFLRMAVIKTYTNIDLPDNDKCWNLVYGTPVFARVVGHENRTVIFEGRDYYDGVIDVEQYEQILTAIDQKIAYAITHNHVTQSKRIDSKIPKSIVGRVLNLEDKSGAGGKL